MVTTIQTVQFSVMVKGLWLTALIDEEVKGVEEYAIRIRFSDGFVDLFTLDKKGRVKGTKLKAIAYARAVRFDITHVVKLNRKKFHHVFQHSIRGSLINVWIIESESKPGNVSYAVYYRQFYRFEFVRHGNKWVPFTKSNLFPETEQELIVKIENILDRIK